MLQCKHTKVRTNDTYMAYYRFYQDVVMDAMHNLSLDNKPIIGIDDNFFNLYSVNSSISSSSALHHLSYFKFINDFSTFGGLMTGIWDNGDDYTRLMIAKINDDRFTDNGMLNWSYPANMEKWGAISTFDGYTAWDEIKNLPYYLYNSDTIAYLGVGHTSTHIAFIKMKSIEDPSIVKPFILIGMGGTAESISVFSGLTSYLYIIDDDNFTATKYGPNYKFYDNIVDTQTIVIEKFVYGNWYSDELFVFNGDYPGGMFKLNNDTYLNIGFNLYIKLQEG